MTENFWSSSIRMNFNLSLVPVSHNLTKLYCFNLQDFTEEGCEKTQA
jgi:hypothetical protein